MNQGYLGLEITATKLRFVYIVEEKKTYVVKRAGAVDYEMDLLRDGGLAGAINRILDKEGISPERVFLSFSRQDTLIRQMTLPKMSAKDLDEVIRSEIQKVPAFTHKEFDYIVNKSTAAGDRIRVIFAALHKEILDYIFREVERSAIAYRHFEISPLNLQELMSRQQDITAGSQALLLVNDFFSYLIIFKNHQYKLLYKTTTGIEHIYPENGKDFSDQVLSSLTSEIKRVLKSYVTENKGEVINRVTLVWDKERASNFQKVLSEKLVETPVNVPSLRQFTAADLEVASHMDNPIYGLACVPIFYHVSKLKAQFAFDHFFRATHFKRLMIRNAVMAGAYILIAAVICGGMVLGLRRHTADMKTQISQVEQEYADLTVKSQEVFQRRDEYVAIREGLLAQASYVRLLNRVSWSQVLAVVSDEMPEDLALTTFKFSESNSATFKGDAMEVETVAELMRRIEDSTILEGGAFDFLREKTLGENKVYQFGIMAQLKKADEEEALPGDGTAVEEETNQEAKLQ